MTDINSTSRPGRGGASAAFHRAGDGQAGRSPGFGRERCVDEDRLDRARPYSDHRRGRRTDDGPTPLETVLIGLVGCEGVIINRVAGRHGLCLFRRRDLGRREVDKRGSRGVAGVRPHFNWIDLRIRITSDEPRRPTACSSEERRVPLPGAEPHARRRCRGSGEVVHQAGDRDVRTRLLGALEVPALGLGCMGMSVAYGERDESGSIETIHRALDLGVTFIDTADAYGRGHTRGTRRAGAEGSARRSDHRDQVRQYPHSRRKVRRSGRPPPPPAGVT